MIFIIHSLTIMFEESLAYRLIKNSGFPLIVRHDRQIYKTEAQSIDLAQLYRKVLIAGFFGYFFGRTFGRREVIFTAGFASIPIFLQLYTDINLKREGKYQ